MAEQVASVLRLPGAFFKWWLDELAGLLPRSLRTPFSPARSGLVLTFTGTEFLLGKRMGRHRHKELARQADDGGNLAQNSEAVAALKPLAGRRFRRWPITLRLARHLGLCKMVDLPLAARDDLHQLLEFELDRLTPFKAEDVCFAWRIEATDPKTGRMKVALEMAPKAIIDRAIDLAALHGRSFDRVELEGAADGREPLDLLIAADDAGAGKGWLDWLLRMLTFALLAVAVALPIQKQRNVLESLDLEIRAIRPQAEESLTLREQLGFFSDEASYLASARDGRPTMTEILAELTRLLPDHSHIQRLRIAETSVDLSGLTDRASDILALFDQAPMFVTPKFISPVTRDQRSGKERFQIKAGLVKGPI